MGPYSQPPPLLLKPMCVAATGTITWCGFIEAENSRDLMEHRTAAIAKLKKILLDADIYGDLEFMAEPE